MVAASAGVGRTSSGTIGDRLPKETTPILTCSGPVTAVGPKAQRSDAELLRLAFLASHGGSSARTIVAACKDGTLDADPRVLICNNRGAEALRWAQEAGLETHHLSGKTHPEPSALDQAIHTALTQAKADLVVLSGYLKMLGPATVAGYRNRILNIHPAPLPRFGGKGMYGSHVHEAVVESGVSRSAICIHLVDEHYDQGAVVYRREVPVMPSDTATTLQERIAALEPTVYLEALDRIAAGTIDLDAIARGT